MMAEVFANAHAHPSRNSTPQNQESARVKPSEIQNLRTKIGRKLKNLLESNPPKFRLLTREADRTAARPLDFLGVRSHCANSC